MKKTWRWCEQNAMRPLERLETKFSFQIYDQFAMYSQFLRCLADIFIYSFTVVSSVVIVSTTNKIPRGVTAYYDDTIVMVILCMEKFIARSRLIIGVQAVGSFLFLFLFAICFS